MLMMVMVITVRVACDGDDKQNMDRTGGRPSFRPTKNSLQFIVSYTNGRLQGHQIIETCFVLDAAFHAVCRYFLIIMSWEVLFENKG